MTIGIGNTIAGVGKSSGTGKLAPKTTQKAAPKIVVPIKGASTPHVAAPVAPTIAPIEIRKFVEKRRDETQKAAAKAALAKKNPPPPAPKIGERVYWNSSTMAFTSSNLDAPVYLDSQKQRITLTQTNTPLVYQPAMDAMMQAWNNAPNELGEVLPGGAGMSLDEAVLADLSLPVSPSAGGSAVAPLGYVPPPKPTFADAVFNWFSPGRSTQYFNTPGAEERARLLMESTDIIAFVQGDPELADLVAQNPDLLLAAKTNPDETKERLIEAIRAEPVALWTGPSGIWNKFAALTVEPIRAMLDTGSQTVSVIANGAGALLSGVGAWLNEAILTSNSMIRPGSPSSDSQIQDKWKAAGYYMQRLTEVVKDGLTGRAPDAGEDLGPYSQTAIEHPERIAEAQAAIERNQFEVFDAIIRWQTSGEPLSPENELVWRTKLRESIDLRMALRGEGTPWETITWVTHPELKEGFLNAWIDAEMTAQRPLIKWEIISLRNRYTSVNDELVFEMVFDWTNFISPKFLDAFILKPLKEVGLLGLKGLGVVLKTIPYVGDAIEFLGRQANSSVAIQVRKAVIRTVGGLFQNSNDFVSASGHLDEYARVIGHWDEIGEEAARAELLRINPTITEDEIMGLRRMNDAIPAIDKAGDPTWSRLMEADREKISSQIHRDMTNQLTHSPNPPSPEEISRLIADAINTYTYDPKYFLDDLGRRFENAQRSHLFDAVKGVEGRLPWTSIIPSDSISGRLGQWAWERGKRSALIPKVLDVGAHFLDGFRTLWVNAVLFVRPAWFVNNYLDSYFRYTIYGKGMFENFDTIIRPFQMGRDLMPADAFMALTQEFNSTAVKAQLGNDVLAALKGGGSPWDILKNANNQIEFAVRLRMIEGEKFSVLGQVNDIFFSSALARSGLALSNEEKTVLLALWRQAEYNPARLRSLVDSLARRTGDARFGFAHLITDAVLDSPLGRSLEFQSRVLAPMEDDLYKLWQTASLEGRNLTEAEVRDFFSSQLAKGEEAWLRAEEMRRAAAAMSEGAVSPSAVTDDINRAISDTERAALESEEALKVTQQEEIGRLIESGADGQLPEAINLLETEEQQLMAKEAQTATAKFFESLPEKNLSPVQWKAIQTQAQGTLARLSDLHTYHIEVFPGPLAYTGKSRDIRWDLVAKLRQAKSSALPAFLNELSTRLGSLSDEEAAKLLVQGIEELPISLTGIKVTRDELGRVVRLEMPTLGVKGFTAPIEFTENQTIIGKFEREVLGIVPPPKPVAFDTVIEQFTPEQLLNDNEVWRALAQSQELGRKFGTNSVNSYDSFVRYLESKIQEYRDLGKGDTFFVRAWQDVLDDTKQLMGYLRTQAFPEVFNLVPPPISRARMPENWATWLFQRDEFAGDFAKFTDFIKTWEDSALSRLASGDPLLKPLTNDQLANISKWGDAAIPEMSEMRRLAYYGGEIEGMKFEGAIPLTNRVQLNYGNFSVFDQSAKSVIPFWMFFSRSVPFWLETFVLHPEIPSFYAKYIRYTRQLNVRRGLITTYGDPLPSADGYIELFDGIYINPLAAWSGKFALPADNFYRQEDDSEGMFQATVRYLYEAAGTYGLNFGPWITLPMFMGGLLDRDRTLAYPLFPQTNLLPPTWRRTIQEGLRQVHLGWLADAAIPETSFLDSLIENRMYYNALEASATMSWQQKVKLYASVTSALTHREGDPLWEATRTEIENDEWAKSILGYFTGIYPKIFTDAQVEMIAVRIQNNLLRDTINSQMGAHLFDLSDDEQEREAHYNHYRFDTIEGQLAQLYNKSRYVTIKPGKPAYGIQRREIMAQQLLEEHQSQLYYRAVNDANRGLQEELQAAGINPPDFMVDAIYARWSQKLDAANEMYPHAQTPWRRGSHSQKTIQSHYEDIWWKMVVMTKPQFQPGEDWAIYKQNLAVWFDGLPKLARYFESTFKNGLRATVYQLQDPDQMVTRDELNLLIGSLNEEGYTAWKRKNDSALQAANSAFDALRTDIYFQMAAGKSGAAREQAEREYNAKYPTPPAAKEIYEWVVSVYGDKFTFEEIQTLWEDTEIWGMEQKQEAENINQYGEDLGPAVEQIWSLLFLATANGKAGNTLNDAVALAMGEPDTINTWYDVGGDPSAFVNSEKVMDLLRALREATANLDLKPLTSMQLQERVVAEGLNTQFKKMAEEQYGEALRLQMAYSRLTPKGKSQFRRDNPEGYELIQSLYKFKDVFAAANPVWAKYYWTSTSIPSSGGGTSFGGGDIQSTGGVTYIYQAPRELYGMNSSDKEKLKLYYEGKKGLAANFKKRLEQIWIDLGKPGGSLNNWIWGALRRRFTLVKKSKKKGKGGRSGGQRGGGQRGSYSTSSGSTDQQAPLRIGMRSTLDATELLDDARLGKGGLAETP